MQQPTLSSYALDYRQRAVWHPPDHPLIALCVGAMCHGDVGSVGVGALSLRPVTSMKPLICIKPLQLKVGTTLDPKPSSS